MQREAHHQRLGARLHQHLLEVVEHHRAEVLRVHQPAHDHRDVVELLRVGHRPDRAAAARAHAHRLVVVAPVERVAVAGLGQQVGRERALGDPWRQPARGRLPALARHALAAAHQQRALVVFAERALALGVAVAMADQLVAACHQRLHQFRAVVVKGGVDQRARGQGERIEQLEAAPGAHAVAVFAPAVVEHVGLRRGRAEAGAQPVAEGEVLEVEAEVDREPRAVGPAVVGPARDRPVVEAVVRGQQFGPACRHVQAACKPRARWSTYRSEIVDHRSAEAGRRGRPGTIARCVSSRT